METRAETISKFSNHLIELIKKEQIELGFYASGKTAESLRASTDENRLTLYGDSAFIFQEKGRGPGKFPPPPVIMEWLENKPVSAEGISKRSLAYLIGRSIAEKGTLVYQGKRQGLSVLNVFNRNKSAFLAKMEKTEAERITNKILKNGGSNS
jgi:hypothetical protein